MQVICICKTYENVRMNEAIEKSINDYEITGFTLYEIEIAMYFHLKI